MAPPFNTPSPLYTCTIVGADQLNLLLQAQYRGSIVEDTVRQSHHFGDRFENIFLTTQQVPSLSQWIEQVKLFASNLLACQPDDLKLGFWFNDMGPGHRTLLHRHDDDDEVLSGVYYVCVPQNSGKLILYSGHSISTCLTPYAGLLAFFCPEIEHEVTINESGEHRLSIGFNIGFLKQQQDPSPAQ